MKNILLSLVLLLSLLITTLSQVIITPNSTAINAKTNYRIDIIFSTTVDTAGYFTFEFPSAFYSSFTGVTCNISCTVTGTTVQVNSSLTSNNAITFMVQNVVNPGSAAIVSFTLRSFYANKTQIGSAAVWDGPAFTPGSISSCAVKFDPSFVRKAGTMTLTVKPTNSVPANGTLSIRMPSSWSNSITGQNMISGTTLNCKGVSGSVKTSPMCSFTVGTITNVTVSSLLTSSTSSTIQINISTIISFPISNSSTEVSVATQDASGYFIDTYTSCNSTAPSPSVLTLSSSTSSPKVSNAFSPNITFTAPDIISEGDVIKYTLPSDMSTSGNTNMSLLVSGSSFSVRSLSPNLTSSNTTYPISSYSVSGSSYSTSGINISMFGVALNSPSTTKPTSIQVEFLRSNIVYFKGNIGITAVSNTLVSPTINATNNIVGASTNYTLSFTTASPLSSTGSVYLTIPSTIMTTSYTGKSCIVSGTNVSSTKVNCTMASNVLIVSSLFTGSVDAGTRIIINFDGVQNPTTSKPVTGFTVQTKYQTGNNYTVDSSSAMTLSLAAETGTTLIASSNSVIVGASATISVNYTSKVILPTTGYIFIGIPKLLTTAASVSVSIQLGTSASTTSTPTIVTNTSNSYYTSALKLTGVSASTVPAGTAYKFTISTLVNPAYTATTGSFSVFFYDSEGYLIESQTSGATLSITTPAAFTYFTITPDSKKNGESTFFLLRVKLPVVHQANSYLQITKPSELSLVSPTCTDLTTSIATAVSCSFSSNILKIDLNSTSSFSTTKEYIYEVQGFTTARTYNTTSSFTVSSFTSGGLAVAQSTVGGISNSEPNYIQNLSVSVVSPSQSFLNSSQTIQFTIQTKNALFPGDYLMISMPTGYTYTGSLPTSISVCNVYTCIPDSTDSMSIKVSGSFANQNSFVFNLSSFRSPSILQYLKMTQYIKISTYQANGSPIDLTDSTNELTAATFVPSCSENCQTCSTATPSICLSCYSSSISNYYTLDSINCVSNCSSGFYSDNGTCKSCLSTCATCSAQTICLSCKSGLLLDTQTSTCKSSCSSGYFAATDLGYVCAKCSPRCLTCQTTSTTCTSCSSSSTYKLLESGSCVASCSSGKYSSGTACLACDSKCATCTGRSDNCTSCASGYSNASGSCVSQCSAGLALFNGVCQCAVACKTCSGTYNNCLTCDSNGSYPYLYGIACVGSCPIGTSALNGVCTTCPSGCSSCNSDLSCSKCNVGYLMYSSKCYASCPSGSYKSSTESCSSCTSPCSTCGSTGTNCTSCVSGYKLSGSVCIKTNCNVGQYEYQSSCYGVCPSGTTATSDYKCTKNSNNNTNNGTSDQLNTTISSSKVIPFPFVIAGGILTGFTLIAKFAGPKTSVASMGISLNSIPQFFSMITAVAVTGTYESTTTKRLLLSSANMVGLGAFFFLGALAIHFLLNITTFFFYYRYLRIDEAYIRWSKIANHKYVDRFTTISTLVLTHKVCNLPFAKCFDSWYFSAALQKSVRFVPLNVIMGVSVLPSVLCLVGGALACLDPGVSNLSSPFIHSLDCVILVVINLILGIWSIRKPQDYFQEPKDGLYGQSDEVYHQTMNELNGDREFDVEEEVGAAGQKPKHMSRIKTTTSNYIVGSKANNEESDGGINIRQDSSQYVSEPDVAQEGAEKTKKIIPFDPNNEPAISPVVSDKNGRNPSDRDDTIIDRIRADLEQVDESRQTGTVEGHRILDDKALNGKSQKKSTSPRSNSPVGLEARVSSKPRNKSPSPPPRSNTDKSPTNKKSINSPTKGRGSKPRREMESGSKDHLQINSKSKDDNTSEKAAQMFSINLDDEDLHQSLPPALQQEFDLNKYQASFPSQIVLNSDDYSLINVDKPQLLPEKPKVKDDKTAYGDLEKTKIDSPKEEPHDQHDHQNMQSGRSEDPEKLNQYLHQISPSMFNMQNQRYEDFSYEAAVDKPIFPKPVYEQANGINHTVSFHPTLESDTVAQLPKNIATTGSEVHINIRSMNRSPTSNDNNRSERGFQKDIYLMTDYSDSQNSKLERKGLKPEEKQKVPNLTSLGQRKADFNFRSTSQESYMKKTFSKREIPGTTAAEKMDSRAANDLNSKRIRDLQKIYLQKLDSKRDKREEPRSVSQQRYSKFFN